VSPRTTGVCGGGVKCTSAVRQTRGGPADEVQSYPGGEGCEAATGGRKQGRKKKEGEEGATKADHPTKLARKACARNGYAPKRLTIEEGA